MFQARCMCALFKAYTAERASKSIEDRLQGRWYLSRDDHDRNIRDRKQRTDIGKYSFVTSTIKHWRQLPAEALTTFPCGLHIFWKRVGKVNISDVKWRNLKRGDEPYTRKSEGKRKLWNGVKRSEVTIFGGMGELSLIYIYAICMWATV